MNILLLIPARGGSETIIGKNLIKLDGKQLIHYVLETAFLVQEAPRKHTIGVIVSTNDPEVSSFVGGNIKSTEHTVVERPEHLCTPDSPIYETVEYHTGAKDVIILLQPTSPFVTTHDIWNCIETLEKHPEANSVQTIYRVPHNQHAWNQRIFTDPYVRFQNPELRKEGYNKQHKPPLDCFGNVLACRVGPMLEQRDLFCTPSIGIKIPFYRALDIDTYDDIFIAEAYKKMMEK